MMLPRQLDVPGFQMNGCEPCTVTFITPANLEEPGCLSDLLYYSVYYFEAPGERCSTPVVRQHLRTRGRGGTPHAAAISSASSTSTLTKMISGFSDAIFSKTGAIIWHGLISAGCGVKERRKRREFRMHTACTEGQLYSYVAS